jgi:flagellar biosynthesis/type III secretory pathway M-ring protein FliF/YscJ
MDYINKLPFLLSTSMTIIIGLLSFKGYEDTKDTYIKMAISLVVFYIIGIIIKRTVMEIQEDIENKKKERRDEEDKENNLSRQAESDSKQGDKGTGQEEVSQKIDYKVDD